MHNFLRASKTSKNSYTPQGSLDVYNKSWKIIPETWRKSSESTSCLPLLRIGRKSGENPKAIRNELAIYFTSEHESIPWHDELTYL